MCLPRLGAAALLALLPLIDASAQSLDLQAGLGYHSDYVSQGRSNINNGGIGEATLSLETGTFFCRNCAD